MSKQDARDRNPIAPFNCGLLCWFQDRPSHGASDRWGRPRRDLRRRVAQCEPTCCIRAGPNFARISAYRRRRIPIRRAAVGQTIANCPALLNVSLARPSPHRRRLFFRPARGPQVSLPGLSPLHACQPRSSVGANHRLPLVPARLCLCQRARGGGRAGRGIDNRGVSPPARRR